MTLYFCAIASGTFLTALISKSILSNETKGSANLSDKASNICCSLTKPKSIKCSPNLLLLSFFWASNAICNCSSLIYPYSFNTSPIGKLFMCQPPSIYCTPKIIWIWITINNFYPMWPCCWIIIFIYILHGFKIS